MAEREEDVAQSYAQALESIAAQGQALDDCIDKINAHLVQRLEEQGADVARVMQRIRRFLRARINQQGAELERIAGQVDQAVMNRLMEQRIRLRDIAARLPQNQLVQPGDNAQGGPLGGPRPLPDRFGGQTTIPSGQEAAIAPSPTAPGSPFMQVPGTGPGGLGGFPLAPGAGGMGVSPSMPSASGAATVPAGPFPALNPPILPGGPVGPSFPPAALGGNVVPATLPAAGGIPIGPPAGGLPGGVGAVPGAGIALVGGAAGGPFDVPADDRPIGLVITGDAPHVPQDVVGGELGTTGPDPSGGTGESPPEMPGTFAGAAPGESTGAAAEEDATARAGGACCPVDWHQPGALIVSGAAAGWLRRYGAFLGDPGMFEARTVQELDARREQRALQRQRLFFPNEQPFGSAIAKESVQ